MATPNPRSYQQFLGDMIDALLARKGMSSLRVGNPILSFVEAAAQSDFRISQDIMAILAFNSIDRSSGAELDRIGQDNNVLRFTAKEATGNVTFTDTNFTKISTKIYAGSSAPNIGSLSILVSDASLFPPTGSVYIGRGTTNLEGAISYSSIVQVGTYWQINLATATTKFHNVSESVILAQGGNRTITAGVIAQTPQGNASASVQFQTTVSTIVPDGETTVSGVPVVALVPGSIGSVARASISSVVGSTIPNLSVTNPLPFVTGRDQESDADYRARIKKAIQTRSKGTPLAIESAVIDLTSPDEPKRIVSGKVIEQPGIATKLVIDDGSGYEELSTGVGLVNVIDLALGGERYLQLPHRAIVKAQVVTTLEAPFTLSEGDILAVLVGEERSEHTFHSTEFKSISDATAFEVASSINGDSTLSFLAATSDGGTKVRIFAQADENESIQVTTPIVGNNANDFLGFSTLSTNTLDLYKNDVHLTKDGLSAELFSDLQSNWGVLSDGETLVLNVDGTGAQTYTFYDTDFVTNDTGYTTLNRGNSLESWVTVFNAKIPGITASISSGQIILTSNLGASDRASLEITACTLLTQGMFSAAIGLSAQGTASQYQLNRNTGQITLTTPLVENDRVTAGSRFIRGYIQSESFGSGAVSLAANANLWVIVDGEPEEVAAPISPSATINVTNPTGNIWRYEVQSDATVFADVVIGDWLVVWDPAITDSNNRGYWRVANKGITGGLHYYVEVEKSAGTVNNYTLGVTGVKPGFIFARSEAPMQQVTIASGVAIPLTTIISSLNSQLLGALASVVLSTYLRITTLSYSLSGSIMLVTADTEGRKLTFTEPTISTNQTSHTAFAESTTGELSTPLFINDVMTTGTAVEPPLAITSTTNMEALGVNPNHLLGFLRPFNTVAGTQKRFSSNHFNHLQLQDIVATALTLNSKDTVHEVLNDDRIFPASPFDFNSEDTLVTEIDGDPVNNTFAIPLARSIEVAGAPEPLPTATVLYGYDVDQGPTADMQDVFGTSFSFNNFKVWMRARQILNPTGTKNAIICRYVDFGPSGETCRVGYSYPVTASSSMSSSVTVGQYTTIDISLESDAARSLTADATTEFDITVPVAGTIKYTWNAVGTDPGFVAVSVGDIVTFNCSNFSAANNGTFRISATDNSTYITVTNNTGTPGVPESNKALGLATAISIYPLLTTASDVVSYVTSSLSNYIEAELTDEDPVGTPNDGSGAISISTLDDTLAAYQNLYDGENWILSTDLSMGSGRLELKRALNASGTFFSTLYSLVGEELRLIPTTADQLSRYLNIPGTSGISTVAGISTSEHNDKLQIYSTVLGSGGSVQITGGTANSTLAQIIGTGSTVDSSYTKIRIDSALKRGFHAGQWVRLESQSSQAKSLGFSATTALEVSVLTPGSSNQIDITAGTGSFQTLKAHSGDGTTQYQVEKHGDFVAIIASFGTAPDFTSAGITEGDWVTLDTGFNVSNRGTFRVVRQYGDAVYIENATAIEEVVTPGAGLPVFSTYDSVQVGDTFVIGNSILDSDNIGSFTVTDVNSSTQILVDGTMVASGPTVLSASFTQLQVLEKTPFGAIKHIHSVAIDPVTDSQVDLVLDNTVLNGKISSSVGATVTVLNKLNFPTSIQPGVDGYRRYIGLIYEANRAVYGDPFNPTTYPGVRAAGAQLNIEGPIIKRIQVSLSVRVRTGTPFSTIQNQVQNAVASVINGVSLGNPVVISDLIGAAASIDGVLAVSVVSPLYDTDNDLIVVQPFEKPLVLDINSDVVVTQVG